MRMTTLRQIVELWRRSDNGQRHLVGTLEVDAVRWRTKLIIDDDRGATLQLFNRDRGGQPIAGTMSAERIEIGFPSQRRQFVGRKIGLERIEGFLLQ